jgi:DNA polymerase-3 subunit alpha
MERDTFLNIARKEKKLRPKIALFGCHKTTKKRSKTFISTKPKDLHEVYRERIKNELEVIEKVGAGNYFLIYDGIIKNNPDEGFEIRGSSVSSLVVHMLGLSTIDPVEHGLLFERFLNIGRAMRGDLPDIDLDTTNPDNIFKYIKNNYGSENTASLMASSTFKVKTQVENAALALKNDIEKNPEDMKGNVRYYPSKEISQIINLISSNYGSSARKLEEELDTNISKNYKLSKYLKENKNAHFFIKYSKGLNNQVFNQSRSSSSVVISNSPIVNTFSVKDSEGAAMDNIIELEKEYIEKMGLVKLDILSNKYLEKVLNTFKDLNISPERATKGYNDDSVFTMLRRGQTVSVNQIKNPKQAELCEAVGIDSFKDLVAVLALLRPGVNKTDKELFIARKQDPSLVSYKHELLKDILEDTYGVIVFDEQIMKISQSIGNFSPDKSDEFRTAIKKENLSKIAEMKVDFMKGATDNGLSTEIAGIIYKDLEDMAGKYTFTKAHSTVYADLAYKQMWLKSHYPSEYIKEFLLDNKKEMDLYMDELAERDIVVLTANINRSVGKFKTKVSKQTGKKAIDFSLNNILKNNETLVEHIEYERNKNGAYENLFDFVQRVLPLFSEKSLLSPDWNKNFIIKKSFESKVQKLVDSGAFDDLLPSKISNEVTKTRSILKASLPKIIENVTKPYMVGITEYDIPENFMSKNDIEEIERKVYSTKINKGLEKKSSQLNRLKQ